MTPSFEQEIKSLRENPELEKECISGLRADCFSRVEQLYDSCGKREKEERPLISVLKTQGELRQVWERGRSYPWRYIIGEKKSGSYDVRWEGIDYVPFAMSYSPEGKVYMGIEVFPEEAEYYLGGLYNALRRKDSETTVVGEPAEWSAEGGPYQLRDRSFKVLPEFLRDVAIKPSLIIACDITMTNFGQAYLKSK